MVIKEILVDRELERVKCSVQTVTCESAEMNGLLQEFLSRDSKYIRTVIATLFLKLIHCEIREHHYKIFEATELIHNASLIHDDVIDDSSCRRCGKTINEAYDNRTSLIAGDLLMAFATKKLLEMENLSILNLFFDSITKMCTAESIQYFGKGQISTIEEYIEKTKNKTAELFKCCLVSSVLCSDSIFINDARDFAINFGIAFQIKNDLDDYRLGIENSSDVKEGIYTAPIILSNSISDSQNAIEKTLHLIDNYCENARQILNKFDESEYKSSLLELVNNLCK